MKAKIGGFLHLCIGEEATVVGATSVLDDRDYLMSTYREHGQAISRGTDPKRVMAELFGREDGVSRGRGGSMHLFDAATRFYGGNAIVGGGLPLAAGLALAEQLRGGDGVTHGLFDLALRGDAYLLEESAQAGIEDVFVHECLLIMA